MIGIIVGSDSALETMNNSLDKLNEVKIANEIDTASMQQYECYDVVSSFCAAI